MISILDGHLDSLQAAYLPDDNPRSLIEESNEGHFDLPRARRGNFAGGLFAIFYPSTPERNYDRTVFPGKEDVRLKPIERDYAEKIAKRGIGQTEGVRSQL